VIGSDGFGFVERPDKSFVKIPQVGCVRIGNDVEIGANTTIDRAAMGETAIEDGVKLDNLIHIAHGVHVGANTAIAAQTGVSGSTTLGKRNRLAGQVGVVGHITTADDVVVFAQSGVSKTLAAPGMYLGSPVTEHRAALRIEAALRNLPELVHELNELRREVNELKKAQSHE
jgi:UDP-3-O-[3-hydroxymyristoyl] glucosamine N-acyltransferase